MGPIARYSDSTFTRNPKGAGRSRNECEATRQEAMDVTDETLPCWCASVGGLLRATIPYVVRSFNESLDESRRLFADHGIADVGAALQPFHEGETVTGQEQIAARRIAAGVTTPADVDKLIVELDAIAVARALLMLRELIQRNGHYSKS
jgi:hypothetical protein